MFEEALKSPAADLDKLLSHIGKSINDEAATSSNNGRLREKALEMVTQIKAHADLSRRQMLEPLLPRAQIEDARRNAEAAAIDMQRLEAAIDILTARAEDLVNREDAVRKGQRYLRAQSQRDAVAKLIRDRFPELHSEYMAMIESIMESNAEVDLVNSDLPDEMPPLDRPEGFARGFHDHGTYQTPVSLRTFRITQSMLPSLAEVDAIAWPKVRIYKVGVVSDGKGFSQPSVKSLWDASVRRPRR